MITTDKSVFPFLPNEQPCNGFEQVLARYSEIVPFIQLSGPTNFAPLIHKAINIVKQTKGYVLLPTVPYSNRYHILLIIADGQVSVEEPTRRAIIEASSYPLSIILVGVGDG